MGHCSELVGGGTRVAHSLNVRILVFKVQIDNNVEFYHFFLMSWNNISSNPV